MNEQLSFIDQPRLGKFRSDHPETARVAAVTAIPNTGTQRRRVYDYICRMGAVGATDDEIQVALDMNPSTQRPRRVELWEGGHITKTERTRMTRGGRQAIVWEAT